MNDKERTRKLNKLREERRTAARWAEKFRRDGNRIRQQYYLREIRNIDQKIEETKNEL